MRFTWTDGFDRDRKWLRLSYAELADRTGISPGKLAKIATGRRSPNDDDRSKIDEAVRHVMADRQSRSSLQFGRTT
jgi:transcriptional regulator with XRE-family HTH domain